MGQYDKALAFVDNVFEISLENEGKKSESCGLLYAEIAKLFMLKEEYEEAIKMQ